VVDSQRRTSRRYGSEGWGFESLRARQPPAALTRNKADAVSRPTSRSGSGQPTGKPTASASLTLRCPPLGLRAPRRTPRAQLPESGEGHRSEIPGCQATMIHGLAPDLARCPSTLGTNRSKSGLRLSPKPGATPDVSAMRTGSVVLMTTSRLDITMLPSRIRRCASTRRRRACSSATCCSIWDLRNRSMPRSCSTEGSSPSSSSWICSSVSPRSRSTSSRWRRLSWVRVEAVAALWVDALGPEHADLVVVAEHPRRDLPQPCELADAQHDHLIDRLHTV
jgi:hypothetical protein